MPFVAKSKSTRTRLYITQFARPREQITQYRAWRRDDVTRVFADAGFSDIEWHLPDEPEGFYQPVLMARAGSGG